MGTGQQRARYVGVVLAMLAGLGILLGGPHHRAHASGPRQADPLYVSGVVSSGIDCLSASNDRLPLGADPRATPGLCPSEGVVALRWQGKPGRARLVLTTAGAGAPHSILVNGKPAASAPLARSLESPRAFYPDRVAQDAGPARLPRSAEAFYLTIPVELVRQGENRIEITTDKAQRNASAVDRWQATDLRIELFGHSGEPGLTALAVEAGPQALERTGDVSLSAVRSIVSFTNLYDGSTQEAAIQVPDSYDSNEPTPLLVYAHGRTGVMSNGIDQFGDAANARGWLLASPELHGSWVVPPECTVYPNDCTWDDKVLAGTTGPSSEPKPGAYAHASIESQYDLVGTVGYMIEHYNVKLNQIYLYGVSMGGQTAVVLAAKYPHVFAATLETMGPTNAAVWYDEQMALLGTWSSDLRATRKECHVDGDPKDPTENPFCYAQRSGLLFARNYVVEPGARPPISITHSTADLLVPVHHSRDLVAAINALGPAQPVLMYEDQVVGPTCPPYYHCYAPQRTAVLDYLEPHRLHNEPTHIQIASDQSKTYYWLNLVQSGDAHWSHVEADAQPEIDSLALEAQDSAPLTLGVNLGTAPIAVPELGASFLQPGLGYPSTTYLVRTGVSEDLVDYEQGYLDIAIGAGSASITVSALTVRLEADSPQVIADPPGTTALTVRVFDRLGNPVPDGTVVDLATTKGVFANGQATLGAATSSGLASTTLSLGAGDDHAEVTATVGQVTARLGVFDFALTPAAQAGERAYNLVPISLDVPGLANADALAAYVGPGVYMVLGHDAATQAIQWRLPGLAGSNFPVDVGGAYFLSLDETAPDSMVLAGEVPPIGEVRFALARPAPGGSCLFNFISVPLHRTDLVDADALAADIGGVFSVGRHDAATQGFTWWMPNTSSGENFAVQAGYPYVVCLDETAPPEWP